MTWPTRETLLGSAKECVETPATTGELCSNCFVLVVSTRDWPSVTSGPSAGSSKP
jgi:hypothetical protein